MIYDDLFNFSTSVKGKGKTYLVNGESRTAEH